IIGLLSYLHDLRLKIAREIDRPAYYVMANSSLVTLATYCPVTKEQFVNLYGLGGGKYSIYGNRVAGSLM
ncbi:MAG: HRDC domain-containing protein, partial [Clostridia bacterium]|nr:HRDC domain-containing protein [Clostridia bacterium]